MLLQGALDRALLGAGRLGRSALPGAIPAERSASTTARRAAASRPSGRRLALNSGSPDKCRRRRTLAARARDERISISDWMLFSSSELRASRAKSLWPSWPVGCSITCAEAS
jgi:hypothetical protein